MDQFVKHRLRCRYYLRYVDDLVLLDTDKGRLEQWEKDIRSFLQKRLRLDLNMQRRKLCPLTNGCNFLGYVTRPGHILVRNRCVNNLKQKLNHYQSRLCGIRKGRVFYRHDEEQVEQLRATLASYIGHFSHASSQRILAAVFAQEWLNHYFILKKGKLHPIHKTPRFANLSSQYSWFNRKYYGAFLFFQVGGFYELYGRRARQARQLFGLGKGRERKRLGICTGFRITRLREFIGIALTLDIPIVIVNQTGRIAGRVQERKTAFWIADRKTTFKKKIDQGDESPWTPGKMTK